MDVGVVLMPVDPWPETAARARDLEGMGFDHLWLYDHLSWKHWRDRPWHATVPWLTGLAACTHRATIGTMVVSPTIRHPLLLAKEVMSIDHVAGGRFLLGLGAGGTGFDATAYGDRPLGPAERAERLEEYATVVDGLLRGDLTDHQGRWYTVDGGRLLPGCVQEPRVPLALATGGPRTTRMAAGLADAWITLGDPGEVPADTAAFLAVLRRQLGWLAEGCERAGRDPADIDRIVLIASTFRAPLTGLEAFVDLAGELEELGFGTIVIHDHRDDDPALDIGRDLVDAIAGWHTSTRPGPDGP